MNSMRTVKAFAVVELNGVSLGASKFLGDNHSFTGTTDDNAARELAEGLAKKNPGKRYGVVSCVYTVVSPPMPELLSSEGFGY